MNNIFKTLMEAGCTQDSIRRIELALRRVEDSDEPGIISKFLEYRLPQAAAVRLNNHTIHDINIRAENACRLIKMAGESIPHADFIRMFILMEPDEYIWQFYRPYLEQWMKKYPGMSVRPKQTGENNDRR